MLPADAHRRLDPARREPWKRSAHTAGMNLPEGKTCGDCQFFARCNAAFGHIAADEVCDWHPVRFVPRANPAAPARWRPPRSKRHPFDHKSAAANDRDE